MRTCECGKPWGPTWDHWVFCKRWPGSEWSRRHGYMGMCDGLSGCDVVHEYEPFDSCGCEGMCHICSHLGCERCMDRGTGIRRAWKRWKFHTWERLVAKWRNR